MNATADRYPRYGHLAGPVVMIGFGSIGRGTLPLILRHFDVDPADIVVVAPDTGNDGLLGQLGIRKVTAPITAGNYRELLTPLLRARGGQDQAFCVNLSVDTSSVAILALCRQLDALYVDTVIEPWPGFYDDPAAPLAARTNYALRQTLLAERAASPGGPTAVSACGANPGMVSWFVKQALLDVAAKIGLDHAEPASRADWAELMRRSGVTGIHIAERDTQRARSPKPIGTFVNTWSVDGFISEGLQPSEIGWGTHERWLPPSAHHHRRPPGAVHLPGPPRCRHPGPDVVPHRRTAVRAVRDPQRIDLDRRLLHRA